MNNDWLRRRWYDFRLGHNTYLVLIISFSNFILISYRLLIERIPFLQSLFTDLWIFILFFIAVYIPTAMIIGSWHRRTQLKVETTLGMLESPLSARLFRIIIDIQTGKAKKDDIEEIRKMLLDIEKKMYNDVK
jgi:hypothetical protein